MKQREFLVMVGSSRPAINPSLEFGLVSAFPLMTKCMKSVRPCESGLRSRPINHPTPDQGPGIGWLSTAKDCATNGKLLLGFSGA